MKSFRKFYFRSSSILNTCSYLARSSRIATAVKKGTLSSVDKLPPRDWRQSAWNYEEDPLQYYLAYSNSGQYCPDDLESAARGREVTAELLKEEARPLQARAHILRRRAFVLTAEGIHYRCRRYHEEASLLEEEAEDLEKEAETLLDNAYDNYDTMHSLLHEAEAIRREEDFISKWEELYDMI